MLDNDGAIPDPALAEPLAASPLPILVRWLEEARASDAVRNHDAMALATVDADGEPQVRMVLCRGLDSGTGQLSFYTNRESPKARDLERSGRASGVFYWDALSRQVRVSGFVERTSDADSDAYFATRHPRAQVAAWTSAQSQPIESRVALVERFAEVAAKFGASDPPRPSPSSGAPDAPTTPAVTAAIPRPPNWGGYHLITDRIEIWAGRDGRLHDRAVWTRKIASSDGGGVGARDRAPDEGTLVWSAARLQP